MLFENLKLPYMNKIARIAKEDTKYKIGGIVFIYFSIFPCGILLFICITGH